MGKLLPKKQDTKPNSQADAPQSTQARYEAMLKWRDVYEAECPDDSPGAVSWHQKKLNLTSYQLLRIAGYAEEDAVKILDEQGTMVWDYLEKLDPHRVLMLDELLKDILHHFEMNWDAAAVFIHRAPKVFAFDIPGAKPIPPISDAELLRIIWNREPGWTLSVASFVSSERK